MGDADACCAQPLQDVFWCDCLQVECVCGEVVGSQRAEPVELGRAKRVEQLGSQPAQPRSVRAAEPFEAGTDEGVDRRRSDVDRTCADCLRSVDVNQAPCSRQTAPTASRSRTQPEKECTQVRQTARVRRVSAASTSSAVRTSPLGSSMRTFTPPSCSLSQGRMSDGKSFAATMFSSPRRRSSPFATRCKPYDALLARTTSSSFAPRTRPSDFRSRCGTSPNRSAVASAAGRRQTLRAHSETKHSRARIPRTRTGGACVRRAARSGRRRASAHARQALPDQGHRPSGGGAVCRGRATRISQALVGHLVQRARRPRGGGRSTGSAWRARSASMPEPARNPVP
jgi:hypothetical protein